MIGRRYRPKQAQFPNCIELREVVCYVSYGGVIHFDREQILSSRSTTRMGHSRLFPIRPKLPKLRVNLDIASNIEYRKDFEPIGPLRVKEDPR